MTPAKHGYRAGLVSLMAAVSLTALATHASAQSWDWRGGDDRQPQWSDDRGYDEPRYERRRPYRQAPRFERRRDRYDDDVQYDPRYENDQPRPDAGAWPGDDDEPQYRQPRRLERVRPIPRPQLPERAERRYRDEDQDERRPNTNSPNTTAEDGVIVADGGAQPYIPAVAPPIVPFAYNYPPGSVVVDTGGRALYYVINMTRAYRYPIAVGKAGFAWTGIEKVSRVADWPDWNPPAEMRARKPELPERMSGGLRNPLGARAIYLGNTLYRIHGTNDPKSIGRAESSGCIRMLNQHAVHLGSLVSVGTEVHVVTSLGRARVAS
jgi:lipoprotein-anchoring transpeptidase ErfK/SrfK